MNEDKEQHDPSESSDPVPPGSPKQTPVKEPGQEPEKIKDPALPDQNKTRLK